MVLGLISFASFAYCQLTGTFKSSHGELYSFKITQNGPGTDCSQARAYLAQTIRQAW